MVKRTHAGVVSTGTGQVLVLENILRTGITAALCTILGNWLGLDPADTVHLELQPVLLGLGSSAVLAAVLSLLLAVKPLTDAVPDKLTLPMLSKLEDAEDRVTSYLDVSPAHKH